MSVPPFEMSPAVIAALRRASAMLSEAQPRLASYRAQTERLSDAHGVTISEDTLNDFAKKNTSPRDLERLARALWAYLSAEFPATFAAAWREVQLEAIGLRDPFAAALHYFYMGDRASDAETLTALSGDFAVYRPHFAEPDTVMVMALRCGADDQPSRFEATMSYEAEDGHPVVDRVEGVMLPYHGSVLFQGRMIGTIAPFVFVLTNFARSDGRIRSGAGAVKAAGHTQIELSERHEASQGRIAIGAMHFAKGLEYRAIAVMACDDNILPLQERMEAVADEAELEEAYETERQLFYVACTRARDRLLISGVRPASAFLSDLVA